MLTLTIRRRQELSILVIFSIVFSFLTITPVPAKAGILSSIGSTLGTVGKFLAVQGGGLVAGYFGAVLGIALGGGPIGMVAGGVGGYIIGKKLMTWATTNLTNFATLAGAVGGGLLLAGCGFPMIAVGVVGGALLARGIAWLWKKLTGKAKTPEVAVTVTEQDNKAQAFINSLSSSSTTTATPAPAATTAKPATPAPTPTNNGQDAYNKYLDAYKAYMAATSKGDAAAAQASYAEYKKYLAEYNATLKGK